FHHPQGYGVGNVGQTASRTGVPLRAGESNYTEVAAETGLLGGLLWTAWGLSLVAALALAARRAEEPERKAFAAGLAAAVAAAPRRATSSRASTLGRTIVAWRSAAVPAAGGSAPALSHVFAPRWW